MRKFLLATNRCVNFTQSPMVAIGSPYTVTIGGLALSHD